MHPIQKQLIQLSKTQNLASFGLRELARTLNVHPQSIKYHLSKLEKAGLISTQNQPGRVQNIGSSDAKLVSIPILGAANAGPATIFAEDRVEGYLKISSSLLKTLNYKDLYAIRASGTSMDRANIDGMAIKDGDYVIVDSSKRDPKNGQPVVAVVDGLANIKRFYRDELNKQIVLLSESSQNFLPIFVSDTDTEREGVVSGTVIQVIKRPKL